MVINLNRHNKIIRPTLVWHHIASALNLGLDIDQTVDDGLGIPVFLQREQPETGQHELIVETVHQSNTVVEPPSDHQALDVLQQLAPQAEVEPPQDTVVHGNAAVLNEAPEEGT